MPLFLAAAASILSACALQPEPQDPARNGGTGAPPAAATPDQPTKPLSSLRTPAERSDYHATASYDEVNAFLKDLAAASKLVRLSDIGKSGEARAMPLALLADPPVANADEAKRSGKLIIALLGGIHSGECDGKEALLALARDLAAVRKPAEEKAGAQPEGSPTSSLRASVPSCLDSCILAFIPIYNPDANEKLDPKNRPGQVGPDTMGKRENAAGLDLNRDFVKLEAPETRALLRFINQYDPHILIDTHTTNGSYHRYPLTFDTNKNPAGDARLLEFARHTMLPDIARAAKEHAGLDTTWYGNFEKDHTVWESYPDDPRYGINYIGMRNRIGILTESYSYATYKERIDAQYAFVGECLAYAAAHKDEIKKLVADADRRASGGANREAGGTGGRSQPGGGRRPRRGNGPLDDLTSPDGDVAPDAAFTTDSDDPIPSREAASASSPGRQPWVSAPQPPSPERAAQPTTPDATPKPDPDRPTIILRSKPAPATDATILGFVEETRDGRTRPTAEPRDYPVQLAVDFAPDVTVERPYAYIILGGVGVPPAIETLQRHGIRVDETREDIELDLTLSTIDAVTKASRPFQNHSLVSVKATPHTTARMIPAGSYLVRTAQPLGNLAAYLLEPTAADGLTTWNYFDDGLRIGEDFPVVRLEKQVPITTLAAPDLPEDRKPKEAITFDLIHNQNRSPNLSGAPIGISGWIDDTHFLQNKDGKLWKVDAATGRAETYIDTAPIAAALEKLPTISRRNAGGLAGRVFSAMDKPKKAFAFDHENDLYWCTVDGSEARRLTSTPGREELWSFSPDGDFIAFVRDNDLYVVDVATATERRLTTGGTDTLRNGKADWVYFEEIFNRNWRTYWWSPDSTRLAYYQTDASKVPTYTIVNDIPDPLVVEGIRYPRVGETNPSVRLFTITIAGGDSREVDLSRYNAADVLVTNVGWFPDSSALITYISDRVQTWADVLSCPADGGEPKVLFRETTKAWVEPPAAPNFLKDGSFLFESERTGWKHYYRYARDGALIGPLTTGEWECRSIVELDEDHGYVYVSGTKDNPVAGNLYKVKLPETGSTAEPARLTTAPGPHTCDVSPGGTYFTDSNSNLDHPTQVALFKVEDQSVVRTLDTNPVRDLDRFTLGPFERVQIPTSDGFILEGSITKPANFDPARRYPVWFQTYAGPHAPTVSDGWQRSTFDQQLCSAGFICFRADPRSASGKGAVSAWTAYKQLGVPELQDIETAIQWLSTNPWIDKSRIGMSGHSYGGFMTTYALTHSKLFAAGVAGAPVTDWRFYDSVYAERYMALPADNKEGYDRTSVVGAAKDLHGKLLLLHGFLDDNVHPQNSTRLIRALQRADKPFELMLYPEARHGIGGKAYNRLMFEFITRTLGAPAGGTPERGEPTAPLGP